MSTPAPGVKYKYNSLTKMWNALGHPSLPYQLTGVSWDYSTSNVPWAYSSPTDWEARIPSGTRRIDGPDTDDWNSIISTVMAQNTTERVLINLPNRPVFGMDAFTPIGSSGDPTYAFGAYHSRLIGAVGEGPDKQAIQMNSDSMTTAQLNRMATMTKASFAPLQMGIMRLDGLGTNFCYFGGVTIRSEDQNLLTAVASDMTDMNPSWETPVFTPQPAPHQGIVFYPGTNAILSHVRFQAAGRAILSQPPFEMANMTTQYSTTRIYNTEFDGRRSAVLDPAQPRRCAPIMANNETLHSMEDVWLHHSNVSRYAANDENRNTNGQYIVRRFKAEFMTDTRNVDPALNGGQPLGGHSPVTPFGWESSSASILVEDGYVHQGIDYTLNGQKPAHFQMTTVGSRNPQGGRLTIRNVRPYNEGYPDIDGFMILRVGNTTYWKSDGYANTIQVYHPVSGNRLTAYEYTGAWPPSRAGLAAVGVRPETHYLVALA